MEPVNYPPPTPAYPYPQPPKKGMSKWLIAAIVAGVLVIGCCGLGVVGLVIGAGEDADDPAGSSQAASSEPTSEPTETSEPSEPTTSPAPDPGSYAVVSREVNERDDQNSQEVSLDVEVYSDDDLEGLFEQVVNEETDEDGAYYIRLLCGVGRGEKVLATGRAAIGEGFPEAVTGLGDGEYEGEPTGETCG